MRIQVVIVAAVLVALGVAVVALAQLNRSDTDVATGSIAVTREGSMLRTFNMEDVQALRSVSVKTTILSSSHDDETAVFTGAPLRVLLGSVDHGILEDASMIVIRASDGYVSSLTPEEVTAGDDVLLVYAKDGESLGTSDAGGTGPFRIVILTDKYGNRCAKWVNEIEIRR